MTNLLMSLELNSMEIVKANVGKVWPAFIEDPDRVTSVMNRSWAVAPLPEVGSRLYSS